MAKGHKRYWLARLKELCCIESFVHHHPIFRLGFRFVILLTSSSQEFISVCLLHTHIFCLSLVMFVSSSFIIFKMLLLANACTFTVKLIQRMEEYKS